MTTESEQPAEPANAADDAPLSQITPVDEIAALYFKNAATRRIIAVAVVFAWLFVFAFGLLIPSEEYRKKLGWDPTTKETQTATELQTRVKALEQQITDIKAGKQQSQNEKPSDAKTTAAGENGTGAANPETLAKPEEKPKDLSEIAKKLDALNKNLDSLIQNPPKLPQDDNKVWAFMVATIAFMPINIALLCILAGCIGACCVSEESVKDVVMQLKSDENAEHHGELRRKLNFLTEHPLYSALRGLVVYLLLSSGLFIFAGTQPLVGDIEQTVSLASYIRLSGIFSFLSYLAGHDPTVFTNMIRMGNRQGTDKHKPGAGV